MALYWSKLQGGKPSFITSIPFATKSGGMFLGSRTCRTPRQRFPAQPLPWPRPLPRASRARSLLPASLQPPTRTPAWGIPPLRHESPVGQRAARICHAHLRPAPFRAFPRSGSFCICVHSVHPSRSCRRSPSGRGAASPLVSDDPYPPENAMRSAARSKSVAGTMRVNSTGTEESPVRGRQGLG
jgi:hypothetical protein